jgi:hypothetical protein
MARAFQFDVGPVVEQLNRILQMELAAIGTSVSAQDRNVTRRAK